MSHRRPLTDPGGDRQHEPAAPLLARLRRRIRRGGRAVVVAVAVAVAGPLAVSPHAQPVAITDVTVIDGTGAPPATGRTVVVDGDRITAVGPAAGTDVPAGARVVDGTGRFLIPGLWDMHVHLGDAGPADVARFVAFGVTGVRDMGSQWDDVQTLRDRIRKGQQVGPRIRASGPVVESAAWLAAVRTIPEGRALLDAGPRLGVRTAEDARAAVDSLAGLGVDVVKVRNAPAPAAYRALVDAARQRGLRVAGHTPRGPGLGLRAAVEAGQASVEHVDVLADEFDGLPEGARRHLVAEMSRRGVWYTPTLVADMQRLYPPVVVAAVVGDTLGLLDPRRRVISDTLLASWRQQQSLAAYDPPKDWEAAIAGALGHLRELHRAGVPFLAGTDVGARLVYPGSSLHDELAFLVEHVGLTPLEALQAATRNAAEFFGEAAEAGTIEVGKRADLVLLGADPLLDVRHTRRIEAIVLRGELYPRRRLDALMRSGRGAE